jgi:hypothetical protein
LAVAAAKVILNHAPAPSLTPSDWSMPVNLGSYGTRYLLRAIVAKKALGANSTADAVYGYTGKDSADNDLSGANRYVLHFSAPTANMLPREIPPINSKGFWSVTLYDAKGFLVENNLVDYNAIGGKEVQAHKACFNSDGSLDIYVQADQPTNAKQFCNWLPAPQQGFILFLRMYYPGPAITSGRWYPPAVQKVN